MQLPTPMPFSTANYSPVPHTWVLANRVNQRSHITKVTKIKRNVTQFIGRNLIITSTQCSNWLLHLGIKTPFQVGTLNVMGASSVFFFFFTYSWIFNTGKLPRETSVTLLIQFPVVKEQFTTVKVTRATAPYVQNL